MRKPFFWKRRKGWYIKDTNRRNQFLSKDRDEAFRIWGEMIQADAPESHVAAVHVIAEAFLQAAKRDVAESTLTGYAYYLASFCNLYGHDLVRLLKPFHVTRWLDGNPTWGDSSRRLAIASVKRCLNWAVDEGLIPKNPLASVKRPASKRREIVITPEQHAEMIAECEKHFRPVLVALKHSGCRPGEVAAVNCENVAEGVWVLPVHKTVKRSGKPKVIYCDACLESLTVTAKGGRESGPLFLNSRGVRWTTNAIRCRMRRLRKKLGLPVGTVAYSYRHSFATQAILNGVSVAETAELLGHSSTKMVDQFYSHLAEQREHLKKAARKAVG